MNVILKYWKGTFQRSILLQFIDSNYIHKCFRCELFLLFDQHGIVLHISFPSDDISGFSRSSVKLPNFRYPRSSKISSQFEVAPKYMFSVIFHLQLSHFFKDNLESSICICLSSSILHVSGKVLDCVSWMKLYSSIAFSANKKNLTLSWQMDF